MAFGFVWNVLGSIEDLVYISGFIQVLEIFLEVIAGLSGLLEGLNLDFLYPIL